MRKIRWLVKGRGHENISALHPSTLEFTREETLTPRGDCILAVSCDKGLKDIPEKLRKILLEGGKIKITVCCGDERDEIIAEGSEKLVFSHPADMVVRRSAYVDERTLAIKANKAACDVKRSLVKKLKNPFAEVKIIIEGPVV